MNETAAASNYRVQPGWKPAIFGFVVYSILVIGSMAVSGVAYDEFTKTAENMLKGPVLALVIGSVFLIAYVTYLRWDWVWREPCGLSMGKLLWSLPILMAIGTIARFASVKWGDVELDLVLAILAAGVLVGFAEELLFRGVWLRSMRVGGRSEGHAAVITTFAFGLFHLPNILIGGGAATFAQVFFAAMSGFGLYLFRRGFSWIVPAMIAHGLWDMSSFIAADGRADEQSLMFGLGSATFFIGLALAVATIIHVWRKDEHTRWQREGAGFDPDAPQTA